MTQATTLMRPPPLDGAAAMFGGLWTADAADVVSFWKKVEHVAAGSELSSGLRSGGDRAIILHGWGCDMGLLPDGRRQIFALHLPGDLVDVRKDSDLSVRSFVALTRLELVDPILLPRSNEEDDESHSLERRSTEARDRLFVHMIRLGQLSGPERMLSFFKETYGRLHRVGLAENGIFRFPLTQEVLADVLGLSIVHVNRTLQQLRREGQITVKGRTITLNQRLRAWAAPPVNEAVIASVIQSTIALPSSQRPSRCPGRTALRGETRIVTPDLGRECSP